MAKKNTEQKPKEEEENPNVDLGRVVRMKETIKYLDLTQGEFGERIGVNPKSVNHWLTGTRGIGEKAIKNVCKHFPIINGFWLLHGVGYMLTDGSPVTVHHPTPPTSYDELYNHIVRLSNRVDVLEHLLLKKGSDPAQLGDEQTN